MLTTAGAIIAIGGGAAATAISVVKFWWELVDRRERRQGQTRKASTVIQAFTEADLQHEVRGLREQAAIHESTRIERRLEHLDRVRSTRYFHGTPSQLDRQKRADREYRRLSARFKDLTSQQLATAYAIWLRRRALLLALLGVILILLV